MATYECPWIFKGKEFVFSSVYFRRTWVNLWSSALRYVYNRTRTARLVRFDGREERGGEKEKTARGKGKRETTKTQAESRISLSFALNIDCLLVNNKSGWVNLAYRSN